MFRMKAAISLREKALDFELAGPCGRERACGGVGIL